MAEPLRALTLDPRAHPRGRRHLSAASGLVCAHQRAYVISDDEHHLAVFRDRSTAGELHRIRDSDLPRQKPARKRIKPDLETLLLLPPAPGEAGTALLALGSGSGPNRNTGVLIPLDPHGEPLSAVHRFDLNPLYQPLRGILGQINIEGAMLTGAELVLLNRGGRGALHNAAAHYRRLDLQRVIDGQIHALAPASVRHFALGDIGGVPLGFTDGAALPDGGWVFSAVAEDSADSYADGPCHGSAVGVVGAGGALVALRRLAPPAKVEGIAVRVERGALSLCMVTDTDDPARGSWLLTARLPVTLAGRR